MCMASKMNYIYDQLSVIFVHWHEDVNLYIIHRKCFIYLDTAICSTFMDTFVNQNCMYVRIFLDCYQRNITNHSHVCSLKLGSITCKTQLIIFIDTLYLIMILFIALVSLCIGNKLGKREIKCN